jgi:hypothetical protein
MIDQASRGPYKPGVSPKVSGDDDVVLHMPRAAQDVEEAERRAAGRQVMRMALWRHDCADLDACLKHGSGPCAHLEHAADWTLAVDVLRAIGLFHE